MADPIPSLAQPASALAPARPILSPATSPLAPGGGQLVVPIDPEVQKAQEFFKRNQAWVKPGNNTYNTQLSPREEASFRQWIAANKVPFDLNSGVTDYDMRGFWKALQAGDSIAKSAVDPNDSRMHYPDHWKTPYHESFSNESQWADPAKAPHWNDKDQLVTPEGVVIYDDRAPKQEDEQ